MPKLTLRVSHRIALIGIVGIIGVVLVSAVAWFQGRVVQSSSVQQAQASAISNLVSDINIGFLQLRRHEKDFLLRKK